MFGSVVRISAEVEPVRGAIERGLGRVTRVFDEQLGSDLGAVNRLCAHVERYRGKMLRPTLVMACGVASSGGTGVEDVDGLITEDHVKIAAVCEMIHMATLVHDDVLDEAETRRGGQTVNALNGNEAAVILGDYMFSAAYHLCAGVKAREAAVLIGRTGMMLCAGELLQLDRRGDFTVSEADYEAIVTRKTASLIGAACRLGAMLSGAGEGVQDALESFGTKLGVAFQIQDDVLDLAGDQAVVGKPLGRDARMGKLTLPMILHLGRAEEGLRDRTLGMLERVARGEAVERAELVGVIEETGSIAGARAVAARLVEEAKGELSVLPRGAAAGAGRVLLEAMAEAVVVRSR